jgi:myo-inositol 2-dehydrogenase/D-chiro-inositol 1-dehydrogenase
MERRDILRTTGAAITVAAVTPHLVSGAQGNQKVRLGVIGCGGRGQFLAKLFQAHEGYEIVALADFFQDRVDELGDKQNVPANRRFTGRQCHNKMFAAGGFDAVAIASPPYFHPEQAADAVAAGLHVYLAKPIAVDVPGCRSIAATGKQAAQKGLNFLVDFQTRTNEFYIEAIKRVHAGAIGELCFGESLYHAERLKKQEGNGTPAEMRLRNWVFDKKLSGDIITEQNIHSLDVMSWIMQKPPVKVTGTGGRRVRVDVGDCWDHFALVYEYADHVGITFSSRQFAGYDTPGGIINRMFGSKGVLLTQYSGEVLIRGGQETFWRGGDSAGLYKNGAVANIETFHADILAGKSANATIEPSVQSTLVTIMGRTAAYEGRTVTWTDLMKSTDRLEADLEGLGT